MERASGGQHHQHAAAAAAAADHSYMTSSAEEAHMGKSSFDNPATKKKPPKLKSINRSLSMAIDNYAPNVILAGGGGGGPIMPGSPQQRLRMDDATYIVEQPLIHRSASPLPTRSALPPQTLTIPAHHGHHGGGGSGSVSPALSSRQQHMHTFQHMAAQARYHSQLQQQHSHTQQHSSSASSPTSHVVSPVPGSGSSASSHHQQQHQPDIYLVSSSSLGDNMVGTIGRAGGSTSPIQFIDDYMLPPAHRHATATHPLKKNMFRRSDTIDVHPASTFQMKKTHSFHAQQDASSGAMDLLSTAQTSSASSSRRTSSVRANFLMPGGHSTSGGAKDMMSRSPSPSRRGCRSHRSFNDPARRPSTKPDSVVESQIRHPSLNDDLMESIDGGRSALFSQANLSLENELFVESRSRSNSHTKMEDIGTIDMVPMLPQQQQQRTASSALLRKSSGSFEDGASAVASATHPPASSSSMKKREHHPHARQHSSHSLELDGRPSTSAQAAASHGGPTHGGGLQLHSAAAAATAAYHFKRGAQQGRSLYLSPNNLEDLQVHHRPGVLAAAAAFQGTNASAKQAKAMHSASVRLRTYREALSASKKSKSFIGDGNYPPIHSAGNEFELTSPHRRNSRPLSSAVGSGSGGAVTIEDIKRSPRPLVLTPTSSSAAAAATAFMEEKRPSFERKQSLTYELSDAAFEQVLRPFHHKAGSGRKSSMSGGGGGSHKALKKKSLSDETDDDEEADRKRKRIVCIVMTVFLCLVCASVFVVILTLTHSSGGQTGQHQTSKKIYTFSRETPVHYNVRMENERIMKETMERARFGKNFTETASLLSSSSSSTTAHLTSHSLNSGNSNSFAASSSSLIAPPQQQQIP